MESTELIYITDSSAQEELLLDLEVRDQDGFRELDVLEVRNREAELGWRISAERWRELPESGRIRVRRLAAPPGERLPRGGYTVELFDLGGRSGEGSFTLPRRPPEDEIETAVGSLRQAALFLELLLSGEAEETPALPREGALLFVPTGGFAPRIILGLRELRGSPDGDRVLLSERLAPLVGESGALYLTLRLGEAGPLLLLPVERLLSGV